MQKQKIVGTFLVCTAGFGLVESYFASAETCNEANILIKNEQDSTKINKEITRKSRKKSSTEPKNITRTVGNYLSKYKSKLIGGGATLLALGGLGKVAYDNYCVDDSYVLHNVPRDYESKIHHDLPSEKDLLVDIETVNNIVKNEPALVKIKGKTIIIGDLHTNPNAARYIKDFCEPKIKEDYTVIFLGDVIDRGQQAKSFDDTFETFETVLKLKISHPKKVFYLRGNHETKNSNGYYGFLDNIKEKYRTTKVWEKANEMFSDLPLCAVRESEKGNKTFMVHGSIPTPDTCNNYKDFIQNLNTINNKQKHCDETKSSMAYQMLWNDYEGYEETYESERDNYQGTIFAIGKKNIDLFRKNTEIANIISGHAHVNDKPDSNYTRIVTSPNMRGDNGSGYIMELKN